jgi:spoIIIJ-associated protein
MSTTIQHGVTSEVGEEIKKLLRAMGVEASVEAEETVTKGWVFNITVPDSYMLIGKQGSTLHALEHLVRAIAIKRLGRYDLHFSLDVDDYARKREWYLKETLHEAVEKLKSMHGRNLSLSPMPNYERRLIHSLIQRDYPEVISSSVGVDPRRKVVLSLKSAA